MLISYAYGWLAASLSTNHLSVPPTVRRHFDCPSIHCHRFISQLRVYLSIPQSIHSCFSQHPLTDPHRFNRRLPVYPPDRPSVCLSVCLPSLVFPATLNHHFDRRLSVDHPSSFQPPAACRSADCSSVCLSICLPALVFPPTVCHRFDHQLPLCLSLCPLMFFLIVH